MHNAFPLPVIEFPLPEEVATASEECSHCQKKREATDVKIALLLESRRNCQLKSDDSYSKLVPHFSKLACDEIRMDLASSSLDFDWDD
uniref:Uncharacterized protein n=1 Tax=Tanacetum cinerariifolium TaxID=118510 RepID=A0A699KW45_TANCI|nr:hypothetical protein [Tanacetum cinerariifolium]